MGTQRLSWAVGGEVGDLFSSDGVGLEVVASVVVVVAAVFVRLFGGRLIRRQQWATPEEGRRWLVRLRNATLLLALTALVVVWADELRAAAITLLAFAVAFVIATKELITAISGSFVRATSASFVIGDRIRFGDMRGVVIDHSLLTTTLLEIGSGHVRTGRVMVVPNSVFVTAAVSNETRGHEYVLHSFTVPVARAEWRIADRVLRDAAARASSSYLAGARAEMEARAAAHNLPMPTVESFVVPSPLTSDTVQLTVRVPVAAGDVWLVEAEVLRAWLEHDEPATNDRAPKTSG